MSTELLLWTWAGFALAALTGFIMFTTNARVYAHNTAFQIKIVLLALAVIAGLFGASRVSRMLFERPRQRGPGGHEASSARAAPKRAVLTSPVATRARKLTHGTAQTALPAKASIAAAAAVAPQGGAAPVAAAARMPAKPAATAGGDQDWETF